MCLTIHTTSQNICKLVDRKMNKKKRDEVEQLKKKLEQCQTRFGTISTNQQVDIVGGHNLLQTAPPTGHSGELVYHHQYYSSLISQTDLNKKIESTKLLKERNQQLMRRDREYKNLMADTRKVAFQVRNTVNLIS